jgi:hypothetical protein
MGTGAAALFSWCEVFMKCSTLAVQARNYSSLAVQARNYSTRFFSGLALLLSAVPAVAATYPANYAGNSVDHYELSAAAQRAAGGPAIYPSGVSDPALSNPPGPLPENAIPPPPAAGLPADMPPTPSPVLTPVGPASPTNLAGPRYGTNTLDVYADPGPAGHSNTRPAAPWPPVLSPQVYPTAQAPANADPLAARSWYTRVEYFHWNERIGGTDFVNEDGSLFTLGYQKQYGIERFRAELFGGDVHYAGYSQDANGNLETLPSNTGYLGLRGEYELVLAPATWQGRLAVLGGLGTRFWIRDLHDGSDAAGDPVYGYQETWWTMYPYLGLESHIRLGSDLELYSEARGGVTALTYQFVSINERPLWPGVGLFTNAEIGLRGPRYFVAARAEVMSWTQSSTIQGSFQPQSVMYTVGGRLGITF